MRRSHFLVSAALFASLAGGAVAAPGQSTAPAAAPDDGRFFFDSALIDRQDFRAKSPIVTVDPENGLTLAQIENLPDAAPIHPPEIVQPVFLGEIRLNGARVGAVDTEALAEFYKNAFGLVEVQRIPIGAAPEIMLNFGENVEAAQANPGGDVVLMPRESDENPGDMPHIIFDVKDAAAVVEAVERHGGTVVRPPAAFGDTGIIISFVADPAGNQIELIQWPEESTDAEEG